MERELERTRPNRLVFFDSKERSSYHWLFSDKSTVRSEESILNSMDCSAVIEIVRLSSIDELQALESSSYILQLSTIESLHSTLLTHGPMDEESAGSVFFKLFNTYELMKETKSCFEVPSPQLILLLRDGSIRFARHVSLLGESTRGSVSSESDAERAEVSVKKFGEILKLLLLGYQSTEVFTSVLFSDMINWSLRDLLSAMLQADATPGLRLKEIKETAWYQQMELSSKKLDQASNHKQLDEEKNREPNPVLGKRGSLNKQDSQNSIQKSDKQTIELFSLSRRRSSSSIIEQNRLPATHRIEPPQDVEPPFFDLKSTTSKFNILASPLSPNDLMVVLASICRSSKGSLQESTQSYKLRYSVLDGEEAFNMSIQVYRCSSSCSIVQMNLVGGCMFSFRNFVLKIRASLDKMYMDK